MSRAKRPVMLVGGVPGNSAEEVFRVVAPIVGDLAIGRDRVRTVERLARRRQTQDLKCFEKVIPMEKVTVYHVQLYDASVISTRMATRKGADLMGGVVVEGSGVEIEGSELVSGTQWTLSNFSPNDRGERKEGVYR